jgi:hypothetical protein
MAVQARAGSTAAPPSLEAEPDDLGSPGPFVRAVERVRAFFQPREEAEVSAGAPRRLSGRIVKNADGVLTVEVEVEGEPLAWAPGKDATITWADGTVSRAPLKAATRDGTLAAGEVARLFLTLEPSDAARTAVPLTITVGPAPAPVTIEL